MTAATEPTLPDLRVVPPADLPGVRAGLPLPDEATAPAVDLGTHAALDPAARVPLYVWQIPVRVTHWVTAGAIVVLSLTGGYIADPFLLPPGGSVMATVRLIHMVAAFALVGSLLVRMSWMLLGNRFSRWSAFIPTSRFQATEILRQAAFYAFIRRHEPKVLGHNQLAASAYVLLFGLLFIEVLTGFALDGFLEARPWAPLVSWIPELLGAQTVRLIHHASMWAILAIALFHVYSSILVDHLEKNGLVASIFSGYKFVRRDEIAEARDGGDLELPEDAS